MVIPNELTILIVSSVLPLSTTITLDFGIIFIMLPIVLFIEVASFKAGKIA